MGGYSPVPMERYIPVRANFNCPKGLLGIAIYKTG